MNEPLNLSPTLSADNAAPRLAPSTLGEILDRTVQLYRSNFLLYLGISLVPTAVVVIPGCGIVLLLWYLASLGGGPAAPAEAGVAGVIFLVVIGLLAAPILLAAYALTLAATPYAASRTYLGQSTTIRAAYKSVWRHGWRYFWLLILEGLIVWVAPIAVWVALIFGFAGLAALVHLSGIAAGGLFALGTILVVLALVAYFFWMLLRLSLAFPACVVEQIPATDALKRSSKLSLGTKGRIFLLYLLVTALSWILSMGITLPLTIVMSLLPGASDPKHASTAGIVMIFVVYGAAFAIQAITRPILGIALTLFYYDQRIRQEGFDIEWMMERAGLTVSVPPAQTAQAAFEAESELAQPPAGGLT